MGDFMKTIKKLFLPIAALFALIADNSSAMEKPNIIYEKPIYRKDCAQYIIPAMNNDEQIGRITYQYLNDQIVKIVLFEVNMKFRNDTKERIGQHLFQRCVDEALAHGCTQIIWTANPTSDLDLDMICMIYTKIVQKLTHAHRYTLIKGEPYGTFNPKMDMELLLNNKYD